MAKKSWKKVDDENVRMVWKCADPDCAAYNEKVYVDLSFYMKNGTPYCSENDCGQDLMYYYTQVLH